MNVEQRLVDALRSTDRVEPSADLWSRVVHSIEEDRAHRRRVVTSAAATVATAGLLVLVGALALVDGPEGRYVRWPVTQIIETIALVVLVAVLGPAIRRFGRGYATDLWRATPTTATAVTKLLDLAYVLVFAGFILITVDLDFTTPTVGRCSLISFDCVTLGSQVEAAAQRIGGLVLLIGLLHALTIMVLPVVAYVSNATRVGRSLPRWLVVTLVLGGVGIGFTLANALIGALVGLTGS